MVPIVDDRSVFRVSGPMRTWAFPGGSPNLVRLGVPALVLVILSIVAGPLLLRALGSSSRAAAAAVGSQWEQTLGYKIQVTDGALVKAGLREPTLDFGTTWPDEIDVAVKVLPKPNPANPAAFDAAARVTWRTFPDFLQTIVVKVDDLPARTYARPQLVASFGPRPAGFDRETLVQDSLASILLYLVLFLDVVAVVIAGPVVAVRAVRGTVRTVTGLLQDR